MNIQMNFVSYDEMVTFARLVLGGETPASRDKPTPDTPTEVHESAQPEKPLVTLETVRAALAELTRAGKREKVRELLTAVGAAKLTEVDPSRYGELMEKVGNA